VGTAPCAFAHLTSPPLGSAGALRRRCGRSRAKPRSPRNRYPLRESAEVRVRAQRLPVERPVVVAACERGAGREGIVGEFPLARKDLGAAVQPRPLADIDARMRAGLIGPVGAARAVFIDGALCRRLSIALAGGRGMRGQSREEEGGQRRSGHDARAHRQIPHASS